MSHAWKWEESLTVYPAGVARVSMLLRNNHKNLEQIWKHKRYKQRSVDIEFLKSHSIITIIKLSNKWSTKCEQKSVVRWGHGVSTVTEAQKKKRKKNIFILTLFHFLHCPSLLFQLQTKSTTKSQSNHKYFNIYYRGANMAVSKSWSATSVSCL